MTQFTDFIGAAKRIEDIDLPRVGAIIGVGEDPIHALIDVESSGSGFDYMGRPKMLFEPHRFFRNLQGKPSKLDAAIRRGLAYKNWGEQPYPRDSYPRIKEAIKIDETAALMSASWGLLQILGENYAMVGYASVQDMVRDFMADEDKHLEAMIRFVMAAGIDDDLRALEQAKTRADRLRIAHVIARVYNGPKYAKHRYHIRIVDQYEWWRAKADTPWSPQDAANEERDAHVEEVTREALPDDVRAALEQSEDPSILPPDNPPAPPAPAPSKTGVKNYVLALLAMATAAVLAFANAVWTRIVDVWHSFLSLFGG